MLDSLDAVAASPEHHKVLFENDQVRVLEVLIRPGEETNVHTHIWGGPLHVLSWSDFIRYDADGNVTAKSTPGAPSLQPGAVVWADPLPAHSFKNTGDRDVHLILTELKR